MFGKLALMLLLCAACNRSAPSSSNGAAPSGAASGASAGSSTAVATSSTVSTDSDPCATVGDAVKSIWDQQGAPAMGNKAVARLQRHCRDDQWSPEVIDCVRSGASTCLSKMTPSQARNLNADKLE